MTLTRIFVLALSTASAGAAVAAPPLFNISAPTLYHAGLQHGVLARGRIVAWLNSSEINGVWNFSQNHPDGLDAYTALRRDSSEAFPAYADDLRGVAEGARVSLDKLWAALLMIELENLMEHIDDASVARRTGNADHCSDIYAVASGGSADGFAEGHNEDWGGLEVGQLYYYVKYMPEGPDADFPPCAGMIYPGAMYGWGVTWNAQGVFWSVNTLDPDRIRRSGVTTAFTQRNAICGMGRRGLDEVVEGLTDPRGSAGMSMNIVDIHQRRMANVETYENHHSVFEVIEPDTNYSHFNTYKHLGHPGTPEAIDGLDQNSSYDRQALANSWPKPQSANDIKVMLSDTRTNMNKFNNSTPIFRQNVTIATFVLDGLGGMLDVWCCNLQAAFSSPVHRWHLPTFFQANNLVAVSFI